MALPGPLLEQSDLARDLVAAGVRGGDLLVVHSSLRSIGPVAGGASAVLDALRQALGPRGTLVMPTFSFNLALWNMPPFEPWRTASRVGYLTELFRRSAEARRTHHPTHSVAAVGPLATEILAVRPLDHEPLGLDSPLDRARRLGGRILLLGVGQERNSTVHVAESLAGAPYLAVPFSEDFDHDIAYWRASPLSGVSEVVIRQMPGSSEGFVVLNDLLEHQGVARRVMIGRAASWIMEAEALCTAVVDLLHHDPTVFLRGPAPSEISRRRLAWMSVFHPSRKEPVA